MLAEAARAAGVPCLFARLITRASDETDRLREWKMRRGIDEGSRRSAGKARAARNLSGRRPQADEAVFTKSRYNAFAGTSLDAHLQRAEAGHAGDRGSDHRMLRRFHRPRRLRARLSRLHRPDAVAAYAPDLHQAALKALELNCAILAGSDDIAAVWKNS